MISRRRFIQLGGLTGAGLFFSTCSPFGGKSIRYHQTEPNSKLGHMLRNYSGKPDLSSAVVHQTGTLIVGAGIGGLSCAYSLVKNNYLDFVLLDIEKEPGGNSRSASNEYGAYPLGAHYLPLPDPENKELMTFLEEIKVIESFRNGLPVYREEYLCSDPEERLLINNYWQEGLIPDHLLSVEEKNSFARFFAWVEEWKNKKGNDGKYAFQIPIQTGSTDTAFHYLDNLSFNKLVKEAGFLSEALKWYIDYCCLDDFGVNSDGCSGWAGLHYFCSRRGKAANAEHGDVLTWPQGNAFLSEALFAVAKDHFKGESVVMEIHLTETGYEAISFCESDGKWHRFLCQNIAMALPQKTAKKILGTPLKAAEHKPWLIANFQLKPKWNTGHGNPLSWDNVLFGRSGLGYIHSGNQELKAHLDGHNLTHYIALDALGIERKQLSEASEETLKAWAWKDMEYAHPQLREFVEELHVHLWGHGMATPVVGSMFHSDRLKWLEAFPEGIFPAHSDYAGYSVFEEAFYFGNRAAASILKRA